MHRKTFWAALKRLCQEGVIEKYPCGKKNGYCVNIPAAQIYLFKLGKLGLGTRYDKDVYFQKKITREYLTKAKEIIERASQSGFNTIEGWRCPDTQHSSEKIIYCLTENGIWVYCCEIGCRYGVYFEFKKQGIQMQLTRLIVGNKEDTVTKPKFSTALHLEALLASQEFKRFCDKICPIRAWKVKECTNVCPFFTMREIFLLQES